MVDLRPAIDVLIIFLLFATSANITTARMAKRLPAINEKSGPTRSDILRESSLTGLSLATTLIYLGLFGYLAANFFAV